MSVFDLFGFSDPFRKEDKNNYKISLSHKYEDKEEALKELEEYKKKGFKFKEKTYTEKTYTSISEDGDSKIIITYSTYEGEDFEKGVSTEDRINHLQKELDKQIAAQNFEACASIKDEISKLKKK